MMKHNCFPYEEMLQKNNNILGIFTKISINIKIPKIPRKQVINGEIYLFLQRITVADKNTKILNIPTKTKYTKILYVMEYTMKA